MLQSDVYSAIDSYLSSIAEMGINWYPDHIVPVEMRSSDVDHDEGLVAWKPVASLVEDIDVEAVNSAVNAVLSPQFVKVLKYKNFMELHLGDMWFFAHPTRGWQDILIGKVFDGHPRELLFDKGFLPFAGCSDWGLYCFCLDQRHSDGEYVVYQWDHADPENFHMVAQSFNEAVAVAMSS